ncbi:MAG: hypothetical protein ABEJ71_03625 [Halodesulfurarchaeum sp.]
MSEADHGEEPGHEIERPDWEDEYLDRVADRLMFNYDLEKDYAVAGDTFDLYGQLQIENQKHFFHPSLNYANHESVEHLFVRRVDSVVVSDLETLVELGHRLADEWIALEEEHFSTDFSFVVVVPEIGEDVRQFVTGFKDRNLLKFGFYGHYEINLAVIAPDEEVAVASTNADVVTAFRTWEDLETEDDPGLLQLISRRLKV